MKAYLKILPYLGIIMGLLGLLLLLSFANYNDCQIANLHVGNIKIQTQNALNANSLEMTRYHTFKALSSLEKSKSNLNDCGCEPALVTAKDTEQNLKQATRAKTVSDSRAFLKIAMQNTLIIIDALKNFEEEFTSTYGDDILVLNTKEVLNSQGGFKLSPGEELQKKMDNSLTEFETSLNAVVTYVDCEDAFNFINKIIRKSDQSLQRSTLTQGQREYHSRIKSIAFDALKALEGCPTQP